MTRTIKSHSRKLIYILGFLAIILFAAIASASAFAAETPNAESSETTEPEYPAYMVNHSSITFNSQYNEPWKSLWIYNNTENRTQSMNSKTKFENIKNIYSPGSNSIIMLKPVFWNTTLTPYIVYPLKAGSTTITVTAADGSKINVPVTIDKNYFAEALKHNPYFGTSRKESKYDNDILYYENKYYGQDAVPNTKITIKVKGKKTIKVKANSTGDFSFNLKKVLKKGEILKTGTPVNIKYTSNGVSYTDKQKVKAWSSMTYKKGQFKRSKGKTKIKFKVANLHKGDYIVVVIKKAKYIQPIKKIKAKNVYVPVENNIPGTPFKAYLRNKFNQNMVKVNTLI